jgi:hypothetical protein
MQTGAAGSILTRIRGGIRLDATAKKRFDVMQRHDSSAVDRFLISLGPLLWILPRPIGRRSY